MLKPFEIHEPKTVEEASKLLSEFGWDAALYAGGTELLVVMREGLAHYPHLINVKTIEGLDTIKISDDGHSLVIGAGATHHAIEYSELVIEKAPLLVEVERLLANIRVRTMGTIGGNLSFAEPHSDPATLFMAWEGASIELASIDGTRSLSPEDFFIDLFMTARQDHELITSVTLPIHAPEVSGSYQKFVQLERPSVTAAVFVTMQGDLISQARVAVGSVGPIPYRPTAAETLLAQEKPSDDLYRAAGDAAATAAENLVSDVYGSEAYKRQLVRTLTARAIEEAVQRSTTRNNAE